MPVKMCDSVRAWLASRHLTPPPDELVRHVRDCAACQAALAAVVAAPMQLAEPAAITCDDCSAQLPAFLDHERSAGAEAAARAYPQVWRHVWTCPACAEVYRYAATLLDATDAGLIVAPAAPPAPPVVRLPRAFLSAVLAPQLAAGAAWDAGAMPQLIAEEALPDGHMAVYLIAGDAERCELEVRVVPPRAGTVIVCVGDACYSAALADGHVARIPGVPPQLLTTAAGPDLEIGIEAGALAP